MSATGLAKCSCTYCGGHLEFEVACAGARVACPLCGNQAGLYIPGQTPSAPPPYTFVRQVSILLNGSVFGVLRRVRQILRRNEVSRKAAVAVADVLRQADQGMITNLLPTGDAHVDGSIRVWAELLNKIFVLRGATEWEIKALNEQQIFSALGSRAAIKSEMLKRVAAQKIMLKHQQAFSAIFEFAGHKMRALKLPQEMEQRELRNLDFGPNIDKGYSLRAQVEQTEFELLQFLRSEFGRYRIANRQVLFTSALKLQEFNRLTGNIKNLVREAQELAQRQSADRQELMGQVGQVAR